MLPKSAERKKAIELRKQGKSYSEILSVIPISQSSLSLWLRNVPLSKQQEEHLLKKRKDGQIKGGLTRRRFRELQEKQIIDIATKEIKNITQKELWLLGIVAYWCEGAKQKDHNVSQGVIFTNSDPFLVKLFVKWLKEVCQVKGEHIKYSLCIHRTADVNKALRYWCKILNVPIREFGRTILKKHQVLTRRKNRGINYNGLIRISVRNSTNLNRKIKGWVLGIEKSLT